MVEIPEHLLQRSREARARLTGEAAPAAPEPSDDEGVPEPTDDEGVPEPTAAAAPEPAPPPSPEPVAPEPVVAREPEPEPEPVAAESIPALSGAILEPKAVLAPLPGPASDRPFIDLAFPADPDSAARRALVSSALWLGAGSAVYAAAGLKLAAPGFLGRIDPFTYGRLAPVGYAAIVYGWLVLAGLAAMFFVTPRLCGVRLYGERVANMGIWLLQLGLLTGVVSVMAGYSTGWTGLELPVWGAAGIFAGLLLASVAVVGTALRRTERVVFASVPLFAASAIFGTLLLPLGYTPGLRGINRAIATTFTTQTFLLLVLSGAALGAVYFTLPKAVGNPLYSHRMAVASFLAVLVVAPFAGSSRLVYSPAPDWLESIGVGAALTMVVPALFALVNLAGTMRQRWPLLLERVEPKFALAGAALLTFSLAAYGLQGVRSFSHIVRFTPYVRGTESLFLLGGCSMLLFAFAYDAVPRISGRQWLSRTAASAHFWLTGIGVCLAVAALWAGGVGQGLVWLSGFVRNDVTTASEGFETSLRATKGFYALSLIGLLVFAAGQGVFVAHLLGTLAGVRTLRPEPVIPELVVLEDEEIASEVEAAEEPDETDETDESPSEAEGVPAVAR